MIEPEFFLKCDEKIMKDFGWRIFRIVGDDWQLMNWAGVDTLARF
jgi:hypothetical protein